MKQKSKNKKSGCGCLVLIVVVLLFFTLFSGNDSENNNTANQTSTEEATLTEATTKMQETEVETTVSLDELKEMIEFSLDQGFEHYEVAKCDKEMIDIRVRVDGLSYLATFAKAGDEESLKSWNETLESMSKMSDSTKKMIESCGYHSAVMLSIENDLNTENSLCTMLDGIAVYNSVSE